MQKNFKLRVYQETIKNAIPNAIDYEVAQNMSVLADLHTSDKNRI